MRHGHAVVRGDGRRGVSLALSVHEDEGLLGREAGRSSELWRLLREEEAESSLGLEAGRSLKRGWLRRENGHEACALLQRGRWRAA